MSPVSLGAHMSQIIKDYLASPEGQAYLRQPPTLEQKLAWERVIFGRKADLEEKIWEEMDK